MQKLKTAKEIGELLNLNQQRIYSLTRQNLIPHIKIGVRQFRYEESEIAEWIRNGGNNDRNKSYEPNATFRDQPIQDSDCID